MLLQYLYTISKLCASISNFVFFDLGVYLWDPAWAAVAPTLYWTQIAVCTLHCESIITRGSCAARAALSRRSGGCTRRRGHTRCTGRAPAAAAGAAARLCRRSGCRSLRSGHQRNAGARDSWRQELTGAKFAVAGAVAAAAGAGINGTQERVILGGKN